MKYWKVKIHFITKEIFYYSFAAYLILLFVETIKEGFVSFFFNITILLVIVLISGIVMVATDTKELKKIFETEHKTKNKIANKDIFFIILLALLCASVIFYKTFTLGVTSIILAGVAAAIVVLLSFLVLLDKE